MSECDCQSDMYGGGDCRCRCCLDSPDLKDEIARLTAALSEQEVGRDESSDDEPDACTAAFDRGVRWAIGLVRDLDLPNGAEVERALGFRAGLTPPWPAPPPRPDEDGKCPRPHHLLLTGEKCQTCGTDRAPKAKEESDG